MAFEEGNVKKSGGSPGGLLAAAYGYIRLHTVIYGYIRPLARDTGAYGYIRPLARDTGAYGYIRPLARDRATYGRFAGDGCIRLYTAASRDICGFLNLNY